MSRKSKRENTTRLNLVITEGTKKSLEENMTKGDFSALSDVVKAGDRLLSLFLEESGKGAEFFYKTEEGETIRICLL